MTNQENITLDGLLLDAAANPEAWPQVIEKLAEEVNAQKGGLELVDFRSHRCIIYADFGLGPEFRDQYQRQYAAVNFFAQKIHQLQPGGVVSADQILPQEELQKSAFYRDFLHRHNIEYILCALILREKDFYGFINLTRPRGALPFGGREIAHLESFVPALQRALEINRMVSSIAAERAMTGSLLNLMHRGIVILDSTGKVVMVNRCALTILEGRDSFTFENGGIRLLHPDENQRFKTLLRQAFAASDGKTPLPERTMLVTRDSASNPLTVLITPLERDASPFPDARPLAAVLINDPDRCPATAREVLKGLYRFTEAEARLAVCLMRGLSLEESSSQLGIALNTARTHLKRLFTKTSTNRQGELVHLLLESPASMEIQ